MKMRSMLLAAAAANVLTAGVVAAKPAHKPVHKPAHRAAAGVSNAELAREVASLKAEVAEMRAQSRTQAESQAAVQTQVQQAQAQVQAIQTATAEEHAQVAAIPVTVRDNVEVETAAAIEKEHHNDKIYFKGITIQPGGFLEMAGIYRSRFQGDDIASSFNVPFPGQSHISHGAEGRFSARQSRVSFLAQGKPNKATTLSMYGEFDFQGGAQTSNLNQSDSYVPRIRNLYGTIDWDKGRYGLHVLAGQNWSLLTMQSKGITPRAEVTPPQIDAQYVPGFAWSRQPGVRVTADFADHKLWVALAAENPQTTFGGSAVPTGVVSAINGNGTAANNQQTNPAGAFQQFYNGVGASLSLNHTPDFIGKVAYEDVIAGHMIHVEGFGIYRTFSTHLDGTSTNNDVHAWGYGGSVNIGVVPKILEVQLSGIAGHGIGRYGSAGLPDVTSDAIGNIKPIKEYMVLAGATLHATKALDLYAFAGEEQEYRMILDATHGLGLPNADNSGCFVETTSNLTTNACGGNTRRIRQLTLGLWDKFYQGSFGRAQIGIQYSYTQRQLFQGSGASNGLPAFSGTPQTHNSMGFVAFRYYPF